MGYRSDSIAVSRDMGPLAPHTRQKYEQEYDGKSVEFASGPPAQNRKKIAEKQMASPRKQGKNGPEVGEMAEK